MKSGKRKNLTDVFIALFSMAAAVLVVGTVLYKMGLIRIDCCDEIEDEEDSPLYF